MDLTTNQSPEWHKQIVEERFFDYENNPQNVISWEEIKRSWECDSESPNIVDGTPLK